MAECPSIQLILPYFGPLPGYADLFFRSCAENPSVNWLLVTDQDVPANRLPSNVRLKTTTFSALKQSIDAIVGFETALRVPYKLSDFRPAYGVIFADEIAGFDFWGHCDMDMIFGQIRTFLTNDVLREHNKVLIHGHLSLYRNCEEANHYFTLEAPGVRFSDVFRSPKNRAFDEFGGLKILLNHHKIPFFRNDALLADIDRNAYKMRTIAPPNFKYQCFSWQQGRLFKEFWDDAGPGRQEYLYIHLQKRPMLKPGADVVQCPGGWYITPREFVARHAAPDGPAEMNRLNPMNVFFDSARCVCSSLWRIQNSLARAIDPWPRRA